MKVEFVRFQRPPPPVTCERKVNKVLRLGSNGIIRSLERSERSAIDLFAGKLETDLETAAAAAAAAHS